MNAKEFYEAVRKMRHAQKDYFRCRTSANLSIAKGFERVVDAEIDRVEKITKETREPRFL